MSFSLWFRAPSAVLALASLLAASPASPSEPAPVTTDGYLNYMPSLLVGDAGELVIVYERLDGNFENGDLMITRSTDGVAWSIPDTVVAGPGNERHPSLVRAPDGAFLVYYLSDETGGYRIHLASSPDGAVWTARGAVDLGWGAADQINPTVCREADGSFTMAYDRLSAGGYVAHSEDGFAWDAAMTSVSAGSLNRIMRHSDGAYLLSYQRRTGLYYYQIDVFTKTSADRVHWSAENRVTTNQNSHDSFPVELADGTYALYYAKSTGGQPYDLMRRTSPDGVSWGAEEPLYPYAGWDTQPHPVAVAGGGVGIAWARGAEQNTTQVHYAVHDIAVLVAPGEEGGPRSIRAYPNPFASIVFVHFAPRAERGAPVNVYDTRGRRVRRLGAPDGGGRVEWDGRDDAGRDLPSGVYFIRVPGPERGGTARVVLAR